MRPFRLSRIRPLHAGLAASLAAAVALFVAGSSLDPLREPFFDRLTQIAQPTRASDILVVDIDREALRVADGAWDRQDAARLIARLAEAGAATVASDFIFSSDCGADAPGNAALAGAIARVPTVLGFLIAEANASRPAPAPPIALRRPIDIPGLWFIEGVEPPCPTFQAASAAAAAGFLTGDPDGRIRRVQAFAIVAGEAFPTLGLEAARRTLGDQPLILGGVPASLQLPNGPVSFEDDGTLRFAASGAEQMAARTLSAAKVLEGGADTRLRGRTVFIGSSLPQQGGLRATAAMPLQPSVQIHADIADAILTGFRPHRPGILAAVESLMAALGAAVLALLATRLRPVSAAAIGGVGIAGLFGGALGLYAGTGLLFDAVSVSLCLLAVLAMTATLQFARVRRAESTARARFSQYLPHTVVARYLDEPGDGANRMEERPVTALFTDIEGFSTLSQKLPPRALVALLDIYYAEVNARIARAGGMVDKVVGDAVHAFFNAPEDLHDHVNVAIDCAIEISALTEEMRRRAGFAEHGFGRTRIGIETGMAVLGEVGAGGKLDYTAHGDAINLAARLQEANKFLGTAICIGPQAAAESGRPLRPLGQHEIRGFGRLDLFTIPDTA